MVVQRVIHACIDIEDAALQGPTLPNESRSVGILLLSPHPIREHRIGVGGEELGIVHLGPEGSLAPVQHIRILVEGLQERLECRVILRRLDAILNALEGPLPDVPQVVVRHVRPVPQLLGIVCHVRLLRSILWRILAGHPQESGQTMVDELEDALCKVLIIFMLDEIAVRDASEQIVLMSRPPVLEFLLDREAQCRGLARLASHGDTCGKMECSLVSNACAGLRA
mmetsp:Transcript_78115/g.216002  ORF Transcript_78115/g.216002 Transcript_78115/m.216002 type:complete len:225 (-) Transcript_78115:3-677(-)